VQTVQSTKLYRNAKSKLNRKTTRRRLVRYSVIIGNSILLVGLLVFLLVSPHSGKSANSASILATADKDSAAVNPLDQLSSADIAVNVAIMDRLPEATHVINQADTVNAELTIAPAGQNVIAKPQVVSTALKSRKDIKEYVAQPGDTVASIAAKFGVTSDSIRWSNGLAGNAVATSQKLVIPPVNGVVYTVKGGDTIDSLAKKFNSSSDKITAANDAEIGGIHVGEQILIPDGSIQAAPATVYSASYSSGFAWGGGSAVYGANGYDYGWCTWYVANRRAELGRPVPSNLGDARTWYILANRAGLSTGSTPRVGAVMVNHAGNHVAVVEQVNPDGSFWISEMNSYGQVSMTNSTPTGGWGVRDYKVVAGAGAMKFIY
jgi:surface antigen